MTTKKIYSPWIKWNGGDRPVPPDTLVEVRLRNGDVMNQRLAYEWQWNHLDVISDIVEYRAQPLTFEDVTPLTEAPPEGTWYWVVQPFIEDGVDSFCWGDDDADQSILHRRMAYLDKEHALIAARHIFGLKGGEL